MKIFKNTLSPSGNWLYPFTSESEESQLVLYFSSHLFFNKLSLYSELKTYFPSAKIIGCSTAGEIFDGTLQEDSVSLAAIKFDKTTLKIASCEIDNSNQSYDLGYNLGKQLDFDNLKGIILLSEGNVVCGAGLVDGLDSYFSKRIPIMGGLAGSKDTLSLTTVTVNETSKTNTIAAIGLYGESIHIKNSTFSGWNSIGAAKKVTKSIGKEILEIDGEPALLVYRRYLGDDADGLPKIAGIYPISIKSPNTESAYVVRTVVDINNDRQSLLLTSTIPTGVDIQFMHGDLYELVDGVEQSAVKTQHLGEGEKLAIVVSCVGRKLLLQDQTQEEIKALNAIYNDDYTMIGFYSFGEISPHGDNKCNDLHNQTITVSTFYES